jgi:hypothetical protein
MKTIFRILILIVISTLVLAACATEEPTPESAVGMANPASVYCEEQGGTVVNKMRGDLGEYGVCIFEDNLQCEEWAMYRGECPVGGIKVTGYVTEAAVFCAITGGEYAVTDKSGAEDEQGTCTFKSGKTCDVWEYYNGACTASE